MYENMILISQFLIGQFHLRDERWGVELRGRCYYSIGNICPNNKSPLFNNHFSHISRLLYTV